MLDRQTVVQYLRSLSQDEIAGLLLAANVIPHGDGAQQTASERIPCPHCGSHNIIRKRLVILRMDKNKAAPCNRM